MRKSVLALSLLAVFANASFNPLKFIKSKLFVRESSDSQNWPYVEWPSDFMAFGEIYLWNSTT